MRLTTENPQLFADDGKGIEDGPNLFVRMNGRIGCAEHAHVGRDCRRNDRIHQDALFHQATVELHRFHLLADHYRQDRPLTANAIATALALARNQFLYFRRLQMRIARLDETLRATRDIERAKQILMKARDLSEAEAYEWMRRNAMNRRQTIAAVATAIVDSHMVLG